MTASIRRRASVGASGQLLLERSLVVELHQRLDARAQGRPAARHRRGLDRLEQLTLGRAVLDGPAHVRHDAVLPAAVRGHSGDDHLAMLDRERLALADRHGAQRPASPDVVGIFLRHPVPERIAVGAGGPSIDLVAHRDLHVDSRRAEGIILLPRRFLHTLASMASAPPTAAPPTSTSRIPGLARSWIDRNFLALGREMRLSYLPPLMVYVAAGIAGLTSIVAVFYIKERLGLSAEFLAGLGFWAGLPWALKVPLGHLVDLIWRWKGALVFVGAAMIAASIGIMIGLLGYTDSMRALASVEAWFVFSTLLAPIGYVVQDVVADAMTVEAVPRFDAEGRPTSMAERKSMNTTVQTLGRVAIIGGSVLVSLANVYLLRGVGDLPEADRALAYLRVYHLALVIPLVSVLGVVLARVLTWRDARRLAAKGFARSEVLRMLNPHPERPPVNWWIIGGGLAFAVVSLGVGMYYGLHHWTAAHTAGIVDARMIVLIDTALESPLGQIAMVPMLAWIANSAPDRLKATFFAVMASFTNLALAAAQLGTKYLNQAFIVTREVRDASGTITMPADYSPLGTVLVLTTVIAFVVPMLAVVFVKTTRFRSA